MKSAHACEKTNLLTCHLGQFAETIQQAVVLVGHPDANVYPLPPGAVWPGEAGEAVWQCG